MVLGHILRVTSFLPLEWLLHSPVRAELGIQTKFGDDALAYCSERMDPETTRVALAAALRQAKRNKAFENSRFIGLALDGTGAGRTYKQPCSLCDPIKGGKGEAHGSLHHFVMISVVGAGLTPPVDIEPYGPGDSEYAAAPFLHTTDAVGLPVVARLKENLPLLAAAVRERFDSQRPMPYSTRATIGSRSGIMLVSILEKPSTGPKSACSANRRHKPDGSLVQAEWLTDLPVAKLGSLSFYRIAKSRWEIENHGFNDGKNRYGMEHICHHEPNSILIVWLLIVPAMVIERLYRLRYLHRGDHGVRSAMDLYTFLRLTLGSRSPHDTG